MQCSKESCPRMFQGSLKRQEIYGTVSRFGPTVFLTLHDFLFFLRTKVHSRPRRRNTNLGKRRRCDEHGSWRLLGVRNRINSFEDGDHMGNWTEELKRLATPKWLTLLLIVLFAPLLLAQETTGGLQGTVKDPSGAVVVGASVSVTTPTLVGAKETIRILGLLPFREPPAGHLHHPGKGRGIRYAEARWPHA